MSPEQARGEGHRVDGRSDLFSLGVVLYELLVGRRPFRGATRTAVLEHVIRYEFRPLRQYDENLPKELDRICDKTMAKRVRERYPTAHDLAVDLRYVLAELTENVRSARSPLLLSPLASSTSISSVPSASSTSQRSSDTPVLRVVPKGLRAFDVHDADFFLDLLPGPRDRQGLPECVRFWKIRTEETDPDQTFAVGLLYGPSGCGKSSLVKAGLLPRVSESVVPLYLEATATATEDRLLERLRRQFPSLGSTLNLQETLAALRQGQGLPPGKKLLLVLDQFEQWLHARRGEEGTELVQALRQCDGGRVQCLVMVRDDFWLAISRFMCELEVRLIEGHNSALVDLFGLDHARKVLAAFGRAFGKLPENTKDTSREQTNFLERSVQGLAEDGKVICVRLALFAEMIKSKPWTAVSFKEMGGTEGVGVLFLEETFSTPSSPPQHRFYQRSARAVLNVLLPDADSDIKGGMRSREELLQASGLANRPKDFEELLEILDGELRLITPSDPESAGNEPGESDECSPQSKEAKGIVSGENQHSRCADSGGVPGRFYQLTHDYLVSSLRDWLTRKQTETLRGRAELRLTERTALWANKPETRYLPAWWEWLNIQLLTRKREWKEPERKMMRWATRYHLLRGLALAVLVLVASLFGLNIRARIVEQRNVDRAAGLVEQLLAAETTRVPAILDQMADYRPWAVPLLVQARTRAKPGSQQELHASLGLLPTDSTQVEYLYRRLLSAESDEVSVLRDALAPHKQEFTDRLWKILEIPEAVPEGQQLRAAAALAVYEPNNSRWAGVAPSVTERLVAVNSVDLVLWMRALRPVKNHLVPSLSRVFRDRDQQQIERSIATDLLGAYAEDQPDFLADLLMEADERQFAALYPLLQRHSPRAVRRFHSELDEQLQPHWDDAPLDPAWHDPDAILVRNIEAAHGVLAERFAFCQTMLLEEFPSVVFALQRCGHRLLKVRPYADGNTLRVAAVWARDGRDSRMALALSAAELESRDVDYRKESYQPIDVAGFLEDGVPRYAVVWRKVPTESVNTELAVDLDDNALQAQDRELRTRGYWRVATTLCLVDNQQRYAAIWRKSFDRKPPTSSDPIDTVFVGYESDYSGDIYLGDLQVDVCISKGALLSGTRRPRYTAIWHPLAGFRSSEIHGLAPSEHRARSRDLMDQGFRPVSLSVGELESGQSLVVASVWHRPVVSDEEKERLAKRQANAAVALLKMGSPSRVWVLLEHQPDPRVRSYIIHRLSPLGADPQAILQRLSVEKENSSRRALLLVLGEFSERDLSSDQRRTLIPGLLDQYRRDPDPGLHGSLAWLLRKWGQGSALREIDQTLARGEIEGERRWFVTQHEQTFVVLDARKPFLMGSPRTEKGRLEDETLHRRLIGRRFALAATHVTVAQFKRFRSEVEHNQMYRCPESDCPILGLTWYEVAEYCNWLSVQEGLPEDQWCYVPKAGGGYEEGMQLAPDYLTRTGYRLPTEAEWEYVCRAGAVTSRYYGETEKLLAEYGWTSENSQERTWPVQTLKPNDWGLFGMHGALYVWCQEVYKEAYPTALAGGVVEDKEDELPVLEKDSRVLRGGSFYIRAHEVRSSARLRLQPGNRHFSVGFRLARSLP